ncbi:SH3 domain-containing YSC84-like protein 1 isoform X4 [Nycticebus coucang]|uniref:SH3 domain-containing YSC84-like protein 1 isoform X4 n=1 Tax=Nycticebus coucang TaxID=9470 RepID=UPI00234DEF4B|nr:SH3 domain-containing YSC84-like protein 1 isoform X4 [Nycticebus coucang]
MNNPIPSNLKSEAKKAAKILREFTEITSRNGPDKIIPAHIIAKAKGLAVLSVVKAGFLVTARGGSGIVLARRPDGKWSAPSAIGIAGLGGGFEIGIEHPSKGPENTQQDVLFTEACYTGTVLHMVSDLVIILNYDRAVEAFAKGGNLTLGGNLTVAVGPVGRNLEGNVALRSSAAVFTYCKSRGLFAGVSLEGSCLIERKETNRKFYCQDIRAYDILFGDIPPPAQAEDLYEILYSFTEKYENEGQRINARQAAREQQRKAKELPPKPGLRPQQPSAPVHLTSGSQSNSNLPIEVTALYSFEAQQPGDLNFQAGDRIIVISKTDSHFDWWEGKLRGRTGIFPANYVTMN